MIRTTEISISHELDKRPVGSAERWVCCGYALTRLIRAVPQVWASPPATEGFAITLDAIAAHGEPGVTLPPGPPFFRCVRPPASIQRAGLRTACLWTGDRDDPI